MAKKTFKKKNYLKNLPRVGGTIAMTVVMAAALATPAHADELDENVTPITDIPPAVPVQETAAPAADNQAELAEANAAVEQTNNETTAENEAAAENNEQTVTDNNTAAEENEAATGGDLPNPELTLPEAPETPDTEGMGAEDYNDTIGEYNENVDDYNEAVDDYNQGVDDYNAEAGEFDEQAQKDYQEELEDYNQDLADHQEAEKQFEEEQKQYEEDNKEYEEYLQKQEEFEKEQAEYEEAKAQYDEEKKAHDEASDAFEQYLKDLEEYEKNAQEYQDQYDAEYEEYEKAYGEADQKYQDDLADYNEARTEHEQKEENYATELEIYDEVTEYNEGVEDKNEDITADNEALENDLHADNVESLDDVGEINADVEVDEDILDTLGGYDDLLKAEADLLEEANDLDTDPRKDAPLGSEDYAGYLKDVEAHNEKVAAHNANVDAYNDAVAAYNEAVEDFNENKPATPGDSTTGTGTTTGTTDTDWGNINIDDHTLGHIDVKYQAAASKDVTVDAAGNETYSDTVTQYRVTGVYTNEENAKGGQSTDYGLVFDNDGPGSARPGTQDLEKDSAYNEFGDTNRFSNDGVYLDPANGTVSFYVTLKDSDGNTHGINVNLNADSVYAAGSYYRAQDNDFLRLFQDSEGNGLPTVDIDGVEYYDISGQSVFLISALTCDGMTESGYYTGSGWNRKFVSDGTLNPDGLDLILNLQTMIEIHQSGNARKINYLGYQLGKTAQASAPTDPGDFTLTEPTPDYPDAPTWNPPTPPGEVSEPGEAPTPPKAPTPPQEVGEPTPPTDPGSFDREAPTAPTPLNRLTHAKKLDKLVEKLIAEWGPADPVPFDLDYPIEKGTIIRDEDVPLAAAPKTGDLSGLWAAISLGSLTGAAVISRKKEEE